MQTANTLPKIKFSHLYRKMPDHRFGFGVGDRVKLLQVIEMPFKDISPAFLEYDTCYMEFVPNYAIKYYPLDTNATYLLLLFSHADGTFLMPTLRRSTEEKKAYYKGMVGRDFEIIMNYEL